MQFHLNGFRPGDPHVAAPSPLTSAHRNAVPGQVDVLIVGCGPAGLSLATQLAVNDHASAAVSTASRLSSSDAVPAEVWARPTTSSLTKGVLAPNSAAASRASQIAEGRVISDS